MTLPPGPLRNMIIPVVDLQTGMVVHGRAGKRSAYRPVEGVHGVSPTPAAIGRWLAELGFRLCYVADLDAIGRADPQWDAYHELTDCGLELCIDAGIRDAAQAAELAEGLCRRTLSARLVVGLETVVGREHLGSIHAALREASAPAPWFSLDLHGGRPLGSPQRNESPIDWAEAAFDAGFGHLIVLDLAHVGMDQGPPSLALCATLHARFPEMHLVAGGGIRGWDDLRRARSAGCSAALVATALHAGRLP